MTRSKILDTRYWMLDSGYWMLDSGYWMLDRDNDSSQNIQHLISSIKPLPPIFVFVANL